MAVWTTEPYRNLCIVCKVLMQRIQDTEVQNADLPPLVRELREVEAFKREMRGIPRLLGHKLDEIMTARMASAKRITTRGAIDEAPDAPAQAKPDIEPKHASKPADP